ncbi:cupin domain-containing protein [Methylobacillus pratensis]
MSKIVIESKPSAARLEQLGVSKWPTWSKEVSTFPWVFPEQEIAYVLDGEVVITPNDGGAPVTFRKGDLVTFPAGLRCTWEVKQPLRKHYQLDGTLVGRIYRRIKLFFTR